MKRLFLLGIFLLTAFTMVAQTASYTVNGQNLDLRADVEGRLTFLWNTFNQEYRYFIKKGDALTELTNKKVDNKFTDSYKEQLNTLTADFPVNTDKTKLTVASLRQLVNSYNAKADPNYVPNSTVVKPTYRLGGFVGVTNNVFTDNPDNISNPQFGIDFEILDAVALPRHAVVIQYKQTLASDEFDFSSSQFSINYRFKFVKSEKIDVFLNTKIATYTFASRGDFETLAEGQTVTIEGDSASNFQGPILFGLGADIALGKGFLTLNYHDAYSFFLDDNGEFPVDVSIGYKFNL
jgi:hypothetical protein